MKLQNLLPQCKKLIQQNFPETAMTLAAKTTGEGI